MTGTQTETEIEQQLRLALANAQALAEASRVSAAAAQEHEERWHALYRVVFPEEFPWARQAGVSIFNFDKLVKRTKELRGMDNRSTVPPVIYG
jgi:hypothetical protein